MSDDAPPVVTTDPNLRTDPRGEDEPNYEVECVEMFRLLALFQRVHDGQSMTEVGVMFLRKMFLAGQRTALEQLAASAQAALEQQRRPVVRCSHSDYCPSCGYQIVVLT